MKKLVLLTVLLLIGSIMLFSQTQNIIFDRITYKDGLNQSSINALYQDHLGFIWIGSYGGLQRYDGYEIVDFCKLQDANIISITEDKRGLLWLSSNRGIYLMNPENGKFLNFNPFSRGYIYETIEDQDGIIWASSQKGLLKMGPNEDQKDRLKETIFGKGLEAFFNVSLYQPNPSVSTLAANHLYDIYIDSRGKIWIGGLAGLFIFNSTTNEFIRIDDDSIGKSRLIHPLVFDMAEENPDNLWVQTYQGFNKISNLKEALSETNVDVKALHFDKYYLFRDFYGVSAGSKFFIDRNHNIWTRGLLSGLIKMSLDKKNQAVFEEVISDPLGSKGAELGSATAGLVDRTGLLWIGFENGGIEKFRDENNIFASKMGLLTNFNLLKFSFNQLYEDNNENLWVCSWGNGIFKISKEGKVTNFQLTHNGVLDTLGNATISILELENGILWVGAVNGCWQINTRTNRTQRIMTEFMQNLFPAGIYAWRMQKTDHYVLMCPNRSGLWIYDLNTRKLDKYPIDPMDSLNEKSHIASFDIINNGDIWVSTAGHEIKRLTINKKTGKLLLLQLPETMTTDNKDLIEKSGLIFQIYEDIKGLFWFCTETGLIKLNLQNGEIRKWTENDGLSSNQINSIAEDKHGNLWLGTAYGLSMLNPETGIIRIFDENDGRPVIKHTTGIPSFKNKKGLIYFSGEGGFYSINSDNLFRNDSVPSIVITNIRLFNKPITVDSTSNVLLRKYISYIHEINLKFNQNELSFTFAALDFSHPAQNKYAYKLEGFDKDWVETDAGNRIATYTNLHPGKYVFRVKGSNSDGVWNETGKEIQIIIHPPPWFTWWAYVIYGLILLLLIRWYRGFLIRREKINAELRIKELEINKIQEFDHLKSRFFANISHEFRTPLTLIQGPIEELENQLPGSPERSLKLIQTVKRNTRRLLNLINQLLDISKLETGKIKLQVSEGNLEEFAKAIILSFLSLAESKKIRYEYELPKSGRMVLFDNDKLEKILTNLISNAFKFTSAGGKIYISIQYVKVPGNKTHEFVEIKVSDTGIGIPADKLDKIFDRFYQVSDSNAREAEGSGIGLALTKELTDLYRGEINVESEVGKGSTFTVKLPSI